MKKLHIALIIICSCGNPPTSRFQEPSNEQVNSKITLTEEYPSPVTCSADAGRLSIGKDGNSKPKTNELSKLLQLLLLDSCELIEVSWVWTSKTYDDMPKKLVYNKRNMKLTDIYTKTNVKEHYSNVHPDSLIKYLRLGKNNLYTLGRYAFDNSQMYSFAGDKPKQSELTGSVDVVVDYVKEQAHDASSVEFKEWSKVSDIGNSWVVRAKYSGTNAFGSVVTNNTWFYIKDDQVIDIKTTR